MATTKPRITITLERNQHELLKRMADYQGSSMSSIIVELLDSVVPVLERVCVAIEHARMAQESVRENLKEAAEESEKVVMPHLMAAMGQLDIFLEQCEKASKEASDPRSVITGVRSRKKGDSGSSKRR